MEGDGGEADEEARGQVEHGVEQDRGAEVEPQVRHRHGHRRGHRARHRRRGGRRRGLGGHRRARADEDGALLSLEIDEFIGASLAF